MVGQSYLPEVFMPAFLGIHHLNLSVTDIERSAAWYRDLLGLTTGWEMEDTEGRGRKVILLHPDSPLRIVLSLHRANDGQSFSEFRTGLDHIALTVADRAELERWQERFAERGVEHSPIKEGATGWLTTFRDPDNIQWEVYTQSK
jgi:glyoxylase I family protein